MYKVVVTAKVASIAMGGLRPRAARLLVIVLATLRFANFFEVRV
jgi:hypothetical protein